MRSKLIPLEDILFVFESWTLMIKSTTELSLEPGVEVVLYDASENKIGKAKINKTLPSRTDINPFEITVLEKPDNLKDVKFIEKI